mmetsp:Transcript_25370/g.51203  ORF Transcript_25370/g.51203 Transcript_25370/m.51203 type:complete len:401 (+) Transcript_25370:150-1352(+)
MAPPFSCTRSLRYLLAAFLAILELDNVCSFTSIPKSSSTSNIDSFQTKFSSNSIETTFSNKVFRKKKIFHIQPAVSDDDSPEISPEMKAATQRETPTLTDEDISMIKSIYSGSDGNPDVMENVVTANLDMMHPRLVVALQMAFSEESWKTDDSELESQMIAVGKALQNVLDVRLRSGRELLAGFLHSGEIRKLDSMIGKAAREGKLDTSFFSVLSMNMKDAALDSDGSTVASQTMGETLQEEGGEATVEPTGANRLQILQHIYTRCQEELENNVAPGIALLNKLLRTEISSIRSNQLKHYLGPQATTITSPDGKTIDLGGSSKALVSHGEFIEALSNSVQQIRTIQQAGGTDRLSAVNLVESIRQVAMEARMVLLDCYGEDSEIVREFQRDLQPVFRPGS